MSEPDTNDDKFEKAMDGIASDLEMVADAIDQFAQNMETFFEGLLSKLDTIVQMRENEINARSSDRSSGDKQAVWDAGPSNGSGPHGTN